MKKAMTLLLALTLALMMALPVLAEGTAKGTITIDNAVVGQKYTIYRILDLESYKETETEKAYAYKANSAWSDFVNSEAVKAYLKVENGYVTWVGENNDTRAKEFANLAKEYAADNTIGNQGTVIAATTTVTFNNLDLGYYLVDSTLGALCSLDTTNSTVTMEEKNVPPTNEKKVEEDSNSSFGDENDADIGQTVKFQSTITVNSNNKGYVFHDKMSAGLTFDKVESVQLKKGEITTNVEASGNYTVKTTGLTDADCTFEVEFSSDFCNNLVADQIIITYTATLNSSAKVGLEGNPNESWLQYGESSETTSSTPHDQTITYTWDMGVLKYANGNKETKLQGVKFVLLKKENDKYKVGTFANGVIGWEDMPAENAEWSTNSILTTDENGKISIKGLDADTYYLREIETLPGFNKLTNDVEVKIEAAKTGENNELTYTTKVVEINNNSGVEMPSTGGIGTTIFYVAGGLLVAVAVVLLVTKKKMSATK